MNRKKYISTIILCVLIFSSLPLMSQEEEAVPPVSDAESGLTNKDILRYSLLGSVLPVTFAFGAKTWDWGDRRSFKTGNERWFERDTFFGGSDKAGHFYAHYGLQRLACFLFNYTEDGGDMKWLYSLGSVTAIGLTIEIGDGFTSHYGFSWQDLVIDYAGIAFGALLDWSPLLGSFLGMSVEYVPTKGYRENHQKIPLDIVNDYSGQKYVFNFKLAGFNKLYSWMPNFLRYLQIDFGYYTQGFQRSYDVEHFDWENPTRHLFVGISINFSEVVSDFYEKKEGALYMVTTTPFEYYRVPLSMDYDYNLDDEPFTGQRY